MKDETMNASHHDSNGKLYQCLSCGNELAIDPALVSGDVPCPHCNQLLWFLKRSVDETVVLACLPGDIASTECVERIEEVVSAMGDASCLILNLGHMRVVVSLFLSMLVELDKKSRFAGRAVKLCGLSVDVAKVFAITKLDAKLSIYKVHPELAYVRTPQRSTGSSPLFKRVYKG